MAKRSSLVHSAFKRLNNTSQTIKPQLLHEMLEHSCKKHACKLAVASLEKSLTYDELMGQCNQIVNLLREKLLARNSLVAVVMDKSWAQLVAVFGVLKSGAAYLPISASYPSQRIKELLAIGQVRYVLTQKKFLDALSEIDGIDSFAVDDEEFWQAYSDKASLKKQNVSDLAYVIFTSGTTGVPKGVMISHEAAFNTIFAVNQKFNINEDDVTFGLSSLDFDLSVYDIFGSLSAGATIVLPGEEDCRHPDVWLRLFERYSISVWNSVPSLLQIFLDSMRHDRNMMLSAFKHLKLVLLSGDWIPVKLIRQLKALIPQSASLVSLGGATEASIWSIWHIIDELNESWKKIPYGRPLPNQAFYVVDKDLNVLAPELPGELIIAGSGLALGYLNDKALTDKKFVVHPKLGKMYRTGDLGKLSQLGYIELIGRIDEQLKIGGMRIEPAEIESTIEKMLNIQEAVVVKAKSKLGIEQLVAFLQIDDKPNRHEIIAFLKDRLPEHLIPKRYCFIGQWPLTVNGKKDKKRLLKLLDKAEIGQEDNAINQDVDLIHRPLNRYPIKANQQGIIYQALSATDLNYYLIQVSWCYESAISLDHYIAAWRAALAENEMLRSYLDLSDLENITQMVEEVCDLSCQVMDWSGLSKSDKQEKLKTFVITDRSTSLDLEDVPTFRLAIIKLNSDKYQILFTNHHVFCDRWSIYLIIQRLHGIYEALLDDKVPPIARTGQYKLGEPLYSSCEEANKFWRKELAISYPAKGLVDIVPKVEQPDDHHVKYLDLTMNEDVRKQLFLAAKKLAVSPASFLMACWGVALSHLISESKVCSGFSISGRTLLGEAALSETGLFANVVPFLLSVEGDEPFCQLVGRVHNKLQSFNRHDFLSLAEILEQEAHSGLERLIDHVVIIASQPKANRNLGLNKYMSKISFHETTPYPLLLTIDLEEVVTFHFAYHLGVSSEFVCSLANSFNEVILQAVSSQALKARDFRLLTKSEQEKMLGVQSISSSFRSKDLILSLHDNIRNFSDKVAVICSGHSYTYKQLEHLVNQLVVKLLSYDAEHPMLLYFDGSVDYLVALLACLQLNITFVPVGVDASKRWISSILSQVQSKTIITIAKYRSSLNFEGVDIICTDEISDQQQGALLEYKPMKNKLAYIFFTSGSTGQPKGVRILRSSLNNQIEALSEVVAVAEHDCFISIAKTVFDISLLEFLLPLMLGAKLCIPGVDIVANPKMLIDYANNKRVTVLQATPAYWQLLLAQKEHFAFLKFALCGGEALSFPLLKSMQQLQVRIVNFYGPTETTIWTTAAELTEWEGLAVPIGQSIKGNLSLVLNHFGQLLPDNVLGELYVGGAGVGAGYLDKIATEKSFLRLSLAPGSLYKTGDLVYVYNKQLYFVGRVDQQVKVRGHRVDLSGLDHFLLQDSQVSQAASIVYEGALYTFVVPEKLKANVAPKLGLFFFSELPEGESAADFYDWYRKLIKKADSMGLNSAWLPERHFDRLGAPFASPVLLNAFFAANTKQIQLRSGSVILPLHNPLHLVEQWSMLDNLSRGRAGLAIASGWNPNDFILSSDNYQDRKEIMFDRARYIKEVWRSGIVKENNGEGQKTTVEVFPKPVQKELPIWVAAALSPSTYVRAGELGLNIFSHLLAQTSEQLKDNLDKYRQVLEKSGYNRKNANVSLMLHTYIMSDGEKARTAARPIMQEYLKKHLGLATKGADKKIHADALKERIKTVSEEFIYKKSLIGSPADCLEVIKKYYEVGVDEFVCLIDFGFSANEIDKSLDHLAELGDLLKRETFSRFESIHLPNFLARLEERLPDFMIPHKVFVETALPLTGNAKVDYKTLVEKIKEVSNNNLLDAQMPENELEEHIRRLWLEVLKRSNFSLSDDFFAAGGHSLQAMRLVSRISDELGINLDLKIFLEHSSIRKLAKYIGKQQDFLQSGREGMPIVHEYVNQSDLSVFQKGLWFVYQLNKNNSAYNDAFLIDIGSFCSEERLINALKYLTGSELIFNLSIAQGQDGVLQKRVKRAPNISFERFSFAYKGSQDAEFLVKVRHYALKPFILEDANLYRFVLFCFKDRVLLLVVMHHIITDGGNIILVLDRLLNTCMQNGFQVAQDNRLDYFDFVRVQKENLKEANLDSKLKEFIKTSNISSIRNNLSFINRPKILGNKGVKKSLTLDQYTAKLIYKSVQKNKSTMFSYLLSVYAVTLFHFVKEEEIQIGWPLSMRAPSQFETVLGLFVNMGIVNCAKPTDATSFFQFHDLLQDKVLDSLANREVPVSWLIEKLKLKRDLAYNPLFQYAFSFYERKDFLAKDGKIEFRVLDVDFGVARYDIELQASSYNEQLFIDFIFNIDVVPNDSGDLFVRVFRDVLNDSLENIIEYHLYSKGNNFQREAVAYWHTVYEHTYSKISDGSDPLFNTVGWIKKNSRQKFSAQEMLNWQRDIINKISSVEPSHILEVGCGTGLLAHDLVKLSSAYTGVDFSSTAVDYLAAHLQGEACDFHVMEANEIDRLSGRDIDTVILNSVVQYFPDTDYLIEVIGKACNLLVDKVGVIFIGDVINYDWVNDQAYYTARESFAKLRANERYKKLMNDNKKEKELFLSVAFFLDIAKTFPVISGVKILPKKTVGLPNELTLFRYDVIFYLNQSDMPVESDFLVCENAKQLEKAFAVNKRSLPDYIYVRNIKNENICDIREKMLEAIQELENHLPAQTDNIFSLDELKSLMPESYSLDLELSARNPLCYEAILTKAGIEPKSRFLSFQETHAIEGLSNLVGHHGESEKLDFLLKDSVDTVSSDLDLILGDSESLHIFLVSLWKDLLDIDEVGLTDNFFELGGDSISSIMLVNKLRAIGLQISVIDFMKDQTISGLMQCVKKLYKVKA